MLVSDVVPDSPAAKAGLQSGDIVLEFDGKKMEAPGDLQRAVGFTAPGTAAKFKVWRDQGERTLELKIGEAPDEREARGPRAPDRRARCSGSRRGPVTPELARQLNLKFDGRRRGGPDRGRRARRPRPASSAAT